MMSLRVTGMTCGHCARTVERAASTVPGVTEANVDLAAERLTVDGTADIAAIQAAVAEAGYEVEA